MPKTPVIAPEKLPFVEDLVEELKTAKEHETKAKQKRIDIENELADYIDMPDEGSRSYHVSDVVLKVTQNIDRKIDSEEYFSLAKSIPKKQSPIKIVRVPKLDIKAYRLLKIEQPQIYKTINKCITSMPRKLSFTITTIGE